MAQPSAKQPPIQRVGPGVGGLGDHVVADGAPDKAELEDHSLDTP